MICPGGWCDWCPVEIQIECEDRRKMTPEERIEHIRQCLRRMKPTMGFELAAAEEIKKELMALGTDVFLQRENAARYSWLRERDLGTLRDGGVFAGVTPENMVLNGEDLDAAIDTQRLAETAHNALNGDAP